MGIFDEITLNHPSVKEEHRGIAFQTKSLSKMMDLYELRIDGSLWHKVAHRVWTIDPSNLFGGHAREVSYKWLPVSDIDGEVTMYQYIEDAMVEYTATYDYGSLVSIEQKHGSNGDRY